MEFKGCENLIFDRSKIDPRLKIKIIPNVGAYWERPDFLLQEGDQKKVQFCSKRGRLNGKVACLDGMAECHLYKTKNHKLKEKI